MIEIQLNTDFYQLKKQILHNASIYSNEIILVNLFRILTYLTYKIHLKYKSLILCEDHVSRFCLFAYYV